MDTPTAREGQAEYFNCIRRIDPRNLELTMKSEYDSKRGFNVLTVALVEVFQAA